jgi:hypothetical protein
MLQIYTHREKDEERFICTFGCGFAVTMKRDLFCNFVEFTTRASCLEAIYAYAVKLWLCCLKLCPGLYLQT